MKKVMIRFSLLFVIGLSLSEEAFAQRDRGNKIPPEDLAAIRPRFTTPVDTAINSTTSNPRSNAPVVTPIWTVNQKLNFVLDSVDRLNVLRKFVPGYTIQIYSGQNREDAGNARKKLLEEMDMRADLQYQQPKFRVRVGYYFTSLDAQRDLVRMKRYFPNAILVPEQVPVK